MRPSDANDNGSARLRGTFLITTVVASRSLLRANACGRCRSPDPSFWDELGRLLIEGSGRPDHYLLPRQKAIPKGSRRIAAQWCKTGNLKAVQKLLGHASTQTTADIYTDWDIEQLTETMREVLAQDDS
jgi:integrase